MLKMCDVCGKEFNNVANHKRCSDDCKSIGEKMVRREKKYVCICKKCGQEFVANKRDRKKCDICAVAHYEKKIYTFVCDVCGKEFVCDHPKRKRCSSECMQEYYGSSRKKSTYYEKKCDRCGKYFSTIYPQQKRCSKGCGTSIKYDSPGKKSSKKTMPTVMPEIIFRTEAFLSANTWFTAGFSKGLKNAVMDRDGWKCYICNKETNLHVHHIIPRKHGGTHTIQNLVTLCGACHRSIETGNMENAIIKCTQRAVASTGI